MTLMFVHIDHAMPHNLEYHLLETYVLCLSYMYHYIR